MDDCICPRVLIIANNCFSLSDSNGRTLQNFFIGWPRESLAQFYIQNSTPDFSVCETFYRVTDGQALRAFLGRGRAGGPVFREEGADKPTAPQGEQNGQNEKTGKTVKAGKKHPRTALTMLLRNLVWNSGRWCGDSFYAWADNFAPQMILLQAGDCAFMFRLAQKMADRYGVPLVIYNSEGYYFKNYDYFRAGGVGHWVYPLFLRMFRRQFRKTLSRAACSIYICDGLKDDYDREFGLPSHMVYTATDVCAAPAPNTGDGLTVSYLGNLGVGRHEPLLEIAQALQAISSELHLDVYGRISSDEVRQAFDGCPGIRYRGFIPYGQVVDVLHRSDILVHAENFSSFYREDLKYAFSTKLADSLASGSCFLLYAPEEMACTRYLRQHDAAWVVSDADALERALRCLAEDPAQRKQYLENAAALVEKNHRADKNTVRFREILCEVWRKANENPSGELRL